MKKKHLHSLYSTFTWYMRLCFQSKLHRDNKEQEYERLTEKSGLWYRQTMWMQTLTSAKSIKWLCGSQMNGLTQLTYCDWPVNSSILLTANIYNLLLHSEQKNRWRVKNSQNSPAIHIKQQRPNLVILSLQWVTVKSTVLICSKRLHKTGSGKTGKTMKISIFTIRPILRSSNQMEMLWLCLYYLDVQYVWYSIDVCIDIQCYNHPNLHHLYTPYQHILLNASLHDVDQKKKGTQKFKTTRGRVNDKIIYIFSNWNILWYIQRGK